MASCTASDRSVTIALDGSATLLPGQRLELLAGQAVLVDKLQAGVAFNGSVEVQSCAECVAPSAALTGPQVRDGGCSCCCWGLLVTPTPTSCLLCTRCAGGGRGV
jgi:hypothetical protein